jgi:hypothetical protein
LEEYEDLLSPRPDIRLMVATFCDHVFCDYPAMLPILETMNVFAHSPLPLPSPTTTTNNNSADPNSSVNSPARANNNSTANTTAVPPSSPHNSSSSSGVASPLRLPRPNAYLFEESTGIMDESMSFSSNEVSDSVFFSCFCVYYRYYLFAISFWLLFS